MIELIRLKYYLFNKFNILTGAIVYVYGCRTIMGELKSSKYIIYIIIPRIFHRLCPVLLKG